MLFQLYKRTVWLQLVSLMLMTFLQRTPVLRLLLSASNPLASINPSQVLRSCLFLSASLGAVDTLAGATAVAITPKSPASATAGQSFSTVFALTGAPSVTKAYTVTGLPAGLSVPGASFDGSKYTLVASNGSITGVPTTAGTFAARITAWEKANASGHSTNINYTIIVGGSGVPAPVITTAPSSQNVSVGQSLTLSLVVTGQTPLTYQWFKNGNLLTGATNPTFTLSSVQNSDAGNYTVTVSNAGGTTTSTAAVLTVNPPSTTPSIQTSPTHQTLEPGKPCVFTVTATGTAPLSYQWFKDGFEIAGATGASYTIASLVGADSGDYYATVTNAAGSATSAFARLAVGTPISSQLSNVSILSVATSKDSPLTIGFVVAGPARRLLLRAIGPTLGGFGVPNTLIDPQLTLLQGTNSVGFNDDWTQTAEAQLQEAFNSTGAFQLPTLPAVPVETKDAALIATISGGHTARVYDTQSRSGLTLVEVYDYDTSSASRIINLSTLNKVGSGNEKLVAGFVIAGNTPKKLLIRGIGPQLSKLGVPLTVPDPTLALHTSVLRKGVKEDLIIATNDDWSKGGDTLTPIFNSVGAFALDLNSKDAALYVELGAGSYTVELSGNNNQSGQGLIEVYEVP